MMPSAWKVDPVSAALVPAQPVWQPREATQAGTRVFRVCVALFVAVTVTRIHDVVPGLAHLNPVKLLMLPLLVATVAIIPRWQVLSAMGTTTAKSVAVITILGFLSIPMSVWPSNSAGYFARVLIPTLILFVVASAGFTDRRTARLCIVTLVLCAGADALYVFSGFSPSAWGRAYIGNDLAPNESAVLFVTMLPFAMMLATERGRNRWLGIIVALLLVGATAKTGSRGGLVGLVVVALVLMVQGLRKRRTWFVLGAVACAGIFAVTANEELATRFRTILAPEEDYNVTDSDGRIEVWKRGAGYMLSRPVLGVGLDGFATADGTGRVNQGYGVRYLTAHNSFLQIGAELGVFGFFAFVTALASAAAGCRRAQRVAIRHRGDAPQIAEQEANLAAAVLCALVASISTGFFLSFAYHPITLFILAACTGIAAGSPFAWRGANR